MLKWKLCIPLGRDPQELRKLAVKRLLLLHDMTTNTDINCTLLPVDALTHLREPHWWSDINYQSLQYHNRGAFWRMAWGENWVVWGHNITTTCSIIVPHLHINWGHWHNVQHLILCIFQKGWLWGGQPGGSHIEVFQKLNSQMWCFRSALCRNIIKNGTNNNIFLTW